MITSSFVSIIYSINWIRPRIFKIILWYASTFISTQSYISYIHYAMFCLPVIWMRFPTIINWCYQLSIGNCWRKFYISAWYFDRRPSTDKHHRNCTIYACTCVYILVFAAESCIWRSLWYMRLRKTIRHGTVKSNQQCKEICKTSYCVCSDYGDSGWLYIDVSGNQYATGICKLHTCTCLNHRGRVIHLCINKLEHH